jgi:ribosome recycling factor
MAEVINLKNMYSHEFDKLVDKEMDPAIKHFQQELVTIRTGRAHPSLVEDVKVTCYGGSIMSMKEIAAISTPDARLIVIQPWDKSIIADIEKAISTSSTGLSAANDGNVIRITLPELSAQRREELVKVLGKKLEECRNSIRDIRAKFRNAVKEAERKREVEEDFAERLEQSLQKIHDKFMALAQQMFEKKEKEIRAV